MECDIDNELVSGLSYTISEYVWLHLRDTLLCLGLIVICAQYSLQLRWYFMNKSYLSRDREFVFHLYPSTSLKVHVLLLLAYVDHVTANLPMVSDSLQVLGQPQPTTATQTN